ncbi:T3SS regulon anti-activator ExsD family protein [Vibrio europaeus]|uniref:T3SS regulon anti-activator ExsD family protein n=1 Tax=Vibrio europaeus TaxID=300876 RepID=A0AAE7AX03_9VIBR|nr:T3SS regulon anti-activator ExsD domain-containing protein [Vibrio europaeus]MDC5807054.1 T3SS regulon anti-activator ExsD family protein [Vibrio europaeus]MDC5809649.1 T3SS regulon anti-activator ExsD family protein [Vibrio europaeus]MDC5827579.1 T3SS regulon anti-activator ExsD family protein [Vibrio europaeus]MDC5830423.1 T3SS regulon anti-activator ExsD family protein [Vibrio europaeus]MDC5837279.1 T3SS regulon anti-activator ExsD family protein [Vibrio europaeus]
MKKQHWRRRSLFPDNSVTKRKVTVLQRGARYQDSAKQTQGKNVVNVSHRQLLSEGVLSSEQLSLLQRLLNRDVIDALCSSQLVKTYEKLGAPLDRFAMRLFLEIGSRLGASQALATHEQRVAYINQHVGYRYNLASPKSLTLCLHCAISEWVNHQSDQGVLLDVVEIEQLANQLQIQGSYWEKLLGQEASAIYVEQQLELIMSQQQQVKEQLRTLEETHKKAAESHRILMEKWQPCLNTLKALSEFALTSPEFFTAWQTWCKQARQLAPELREVWEACDHIYRDLNAVAKLWQWFQDMQSVGDVDLYYFDVQSGQFGQAYNHMSHI